MSKDLDLSEDTIRQYYGRQESVGCYYLGEILLLAKDVKVSEFAAQRLIYYPPQSFFVLSKEGKNLLDRLCHFDRQSTTALELHRR